MLELDSPVQQTDCDWTSLNSKTVKVTRISQIKNEKILFDVNESFGVIK